MAASGEKGAPLPFFPDDQVRVLAHKLEDVQRAQAAAASDLATIKELYLRQTRKLEAAARGREAAERRLADLTLTCSAQEEFIGRLHLEREQRLAELERLRLQLQALEGAVVLPPTAEVVEREEAQAVDDSEADGLRVRVDKQEVKLQAAQATILGLQAEKEALAAEYAKQRLAVEESSRRNAEAETEMARLTAALATQDVQLKDTQNMRTSAEDQVKQQRGQFKNQVRELTEALQLAKSAAVTEQATLAGQVREQSLRADDALRARQALERDLATLRNEFAGARAEWQEAAERKQTVDEAARLQLQHLHSEQLRAAADKVEHMEAEVAAFEREVALLKGQHLQQVQLAQDTARGREAAEAEVRLLREQLAAQTLKVQNAEQRLLLAEGEGARLREALAKQEQVVVDVSRMKADTEQQLKRLRETSKLEIRDLTERLHQTQLTLAADRSTLTKQLQLQTQRADAATGNVHALERELDAVSQKLEREVFALSAASAELQTVRNVNAQMKEQNAAQVSTMEERMARLTANLRALEQELKTVKGQYVQQVQLVQVTEQGRQRAEFGAEELVTRLNAQIEELRAAEASAQAAAADASAFKELYHQLVEKVKEAERAQGNMAAETQRLRLQHSEQIIRFENEVASLQGALAGAQAGSLALQSSLSAQADQLRIAEGGRAAAEARAAKLETELGHWLQRTKVAEEARANVEQMAQRLSNENAQQVQALLQKVHHFETEVAELEAELHTLHSQQTTSQMSPLAFLFGAREPVSPRAARTATEAADLRSQLSSLERKLTEMERAKAATEKDVLILQGWYASQDRMVATAEKGRKVAEEEATRLRRRLAKQEEAARRLERQKETAEKEIGRLQESMASRPGGKVGRRLSFAWL